ncbi:MAG: RluA family pseudouridine synthase [Pseudomonadota bacterium]
MYKVILDDEYFIGVDKLSPVPCIRQGDSAGLSDELVLEYPALSSIKDFGFTHRLDNETLGVLLIAKTQKYYDGIRELFENKLVEKTYLARVNGVVKDTSGVVDTPIAHSDKTAKKMLAVKPGYRSFRGAPREALTEWRVVKTNADTTDLALTTSTGVRHQIRIHMASIGFPICGDRLYNKNNSTCPSLMLMAKSISFKCPVREKQFELVSSLSLEEMFL